MTVRSTWTGPDPAALIPLVDGLIADALAGAMAPFQAGAETAYAGTRFADEFHVTPAPLVREATLINDNPLLEVVEFPTDPHEIHASAGAYLHFYWAARGRWVRTPVVHHPGTAGKGYIAPLFDAASADLGARLARGWERLRVA